MRRRRFLAGSASAGAATVAGCVDAFPLGSETSTRQETVPAVVDESSIAYTYGAATGNRVASGAGALDATDPVSVELTGPPVWLVGAADPDGGGTLWVAALEDGGLDAVRVADGDWSDVSVSPSSLPGGTPPAFDASAKRVLEPTADASTLTHPTPTPAGTVVVHGDGTLEVDGAMHAVDALPDARVVVGDEYAAVLAGATRQYDHRALGDGIEASEVAVVSLPDDDPQTTAGEPAVSTFPVARGVVEGISPIIADVTGDGRQHLVVTESDADDGARIVAYDADGAVVARGPPVGTGYRWRHQLAVAPFAPDGVPEIAVVRTPHIGGTVEFYRRDGDRFRIAATASGYSSHALGSRNLDGARAFDADGDGRVELVVPTDDRNALAVLSRTSSGVEVTECLKTARLSANLATATVDGATSLGVAHNDFLEVWPA